MLVNVTIYDTRQFLTQTRLVNPDYLLGYPTICNIALHGLVNVSIFGASEVIGGGTPVLSPPHLDNVSTFGAATIANYQQYLEPETIANEESFGAPDVWIFGILTPISIDNASTFGSPALVQDQFIEAAHYDNTSTFGEPDIASEAAPIAVTTIGTATTGASATLSIAVPAGSVPAGSLIFVAACNEWSPGLTKIEDTAGNIYSRATKSSASYTPLTEGWYCKNCLALSSGNSITATNGAGARLRISALYAENVETSSPLDRAVNTRGASGTQPSLASGALAVIGELVIGVVGTASARTMTQDGDFAAPPDEQVSTGTYAVYGGYRVMGEDTSSQTYNPTFTPDGLWSEVVCTFKPAA
jgi:hypothetical protein